MACHRHTISDHIVYSILHRPLSPHTHTHTPTPNRRAPSPAPRRPPQPSAHNLNRRDARARHLAALVLAALPTALDKQQRPPRPARLVVPELGVNRKRGMQRLRRRAPTPAGL